MSLIEKLECLEQISWPRSLVHDRNDCNDVRDRTLAPAWWVAPQSRKMSSHQHVHAHTHERGGHDTAFAVGTLLNAAFVVVEGAYGLIGHSMALLADAAHNLSDVAALLIAWAASALARQRPSTRFTYGYRGSSILAALLNAVILFIAVGA